MKSYILSFACCLVIYFASTSAFAQVGTGTGTATTYTIQAPNPAGTNVSRTYELYVPSSYNSSSSVPLMFCYHGTGSTSLQVEQMTGFDLIADTANFIIVYPQALTQTTGPQNGSVAWTTLETVAKSQASDLKFTSMILDSIVAHYNINTCKVYATGFSSGGFMANDAGCFLSSHFAAIASVSGSMMPAHLSACAPSHPTPYLRIHGDSDGTVSYNGGGTGSYDSVATVVRYWVNYDTCTKTPTQTNLPDTDPNDGTTVQDYLYPNGKNGSKVEHLKIIGGSHSWPTLNSTTSGQNGDISASIRIWQFFKPYCLGDLTGGSCAPPSISSQPANSTICVGNSTSFNVTAVGSGLTYQWQVNQGSGFNNLSNSAPYSGVTTATLTITNSTSGLNGYSYQCIIKGSGTCGASTNSNAATLTVNSVPTITGTTPASRCDAGSVTLGATSSAGTINWYAASTGGNSLGTGTSFITPSISATTPYYVDATNGGCTTAIRTSITATVTTTPSTPTVTSNGPVCVGSTINLTSSTLAGATYSWTGPNSYTSTSPTPTISSATTVMAGTYSVTVTENGCTGGAGTTDVVVNQITTPAVSIAITAGSNPTCTGQSVTFTASPNNSGTTPAYQWTVNNTNVGTNSTTYSSSSLANGDVIACILTSNASCANPTTASSNTITITVSGLLTPSVTIASSSGSNTTCAGMAVTFTATPTNGGATPSYQWTLDGGNVGTNSATYSNASLTNGQLVSCTMSSSSSCVSPTTASSNTITMSVTATLTPAVSIAINSGSNSICAGALVTYTATPTNGGTTPSYQWIVNNANVGTNSSTYSSTGFANGDVIACVLTSNANCANPTTSTSNSITMNVTPTVTPAISIAITAGNNPTCAGQSVIFTASPTNGGTTPAYQWTVNNTNVGTNSNTYSSSGFANGDVIACVLTSNASCANPTTASSNTITITVTGLLTPSLTIATSSGINTTCAGTAVTFTATPTNGGATPSYQWTVDGANVGTNNPTYVASFTNGQQVSCTMTSSSACVNPTTAISNTVTMSVTSTVIPSVFIAGSNTICSGSAATFTATATNAGTTPTYVWNVNGGTVGTTDIYSSSTLNNGDVITCVLTSNASCANPTTASSNSITMTITPTVTPSVSIGISNGSNPTCAGSSITFTATPTNGGTTPTYIWNVNGGTVGTNSNTYSSTSLANGDVIACILNSNANCINTATATSNTITMSITTNTVVPFVTIVGSSNSICAGTAVTFTATPTNGGTTPSYQWMVNGGNVGTNSPTYSSTALTNGQVVSCSMTSSLSCGSATTTSNSITMNVISLITPSVSINITTGSNPTCAGQSVSFTASPTNGGTTLVYQWTVNNGNVGTNSTTYTSTSFANGDVVACVLTSNANCINTTTATSSGVTMTMTAIAAPSITISGSNAICAGAAVTFTATPINGGATPSYQWTLDGGNVGSNSATYSNASLTNGQIISCTMTSSSACANPKTAISNTITINVTAIVTPSVSIAITSGSNPTSAGQSITFSATPTNGGSTPAYQWQLNNANVGTNSATYTSSTFTSGDAVSCMLTSNAACVSTATVISTNTISIAVAATITNTTTVHVINTANAKVKSNVTSDGGSPVTAKGTVWSTSPNPTTALTTKTIDAGGVGAFTDTITGLLPATTYYVRTYATNANGTVYSNEVVYTTPPVNTCSPDTSITLATPGIFPKSLPPVNTSNLTINQTFTYSIPFTYTNKQGMVVTIDSSFLTGILNLPPGLSYQCGRPNCVFYPGEIGCFVVSGTLPSVNNQTYYTEFTVTDYGIINTPQYGLQDLQTYSPNYTADTMVFKVDNSAVLGIETFDTNTLNIVQCSPNPFNNTVNIKFTTPEAGNVDFYINDIYGRELYRTVVNAFSGINTINYSSDNLSAGTYYFTIGNSGNRITKMMIAIK